MQGGGGGLSVDGCLRVEWLRVLQCCGYVCPATACSLTDTTADYVTCNAVDLFDSASGLWSTAQLSVARYDLAAASVGNVALFAGGWTGSALLCREGRGDGVLLVACVLSVCSCCGVVVLFAPATACCLTRATAGGVASNAVDLYNSATGTWSTASLSVVRWGLAAASVGTVALFAGGNTGSALLFREWFGMEC